MLQSPIATAADYADAMLTARRAKNLIFLALLLMLLAQLAIFFSARYKPELIDPANASDSMNHAFAFLRYVVGIIDFLGIVLTIVLALVLLLLVKIMLVGRLIGVAKVTGAFIWCMILALLLFPWQAFLTNPSLRSPALRQAATMPTLVLDLSPASMPTTSPGITLTAPQADFKVPGVLYTWAELLHPEVGARFGDQLPTEAKVLRWSRYVGFPIIAIFLLLAIQVKSSRGLRLALGEAEYDPSQIEGQAL